MVAVVLAPNSHQCIANHHRDPSSISGFTGSRQPNIHIPLRPLNKQYLREVGSSATFCWQWVRLLTRILPYRQFMLSTHQFCVQFGHITAQFLFLTIKFGKIKWRFSTCNCFNFSFSSLYSLWHFALSWRSYMWTSVQCGFLVIHTYCILCCMGWTPWGHVTCICIFEMMPSLA